MNKKTTLDIISKSNKTTLYSISFEKDGTTEFEKILKENIEKGYISVNEKELIGTDNIVFEI